MAARRYWPATRAERERERPMESLYRLGADIGFCESRLTRLGKTWRTAAPSFAKSGEEKERAFERPFAIPPIRSRVQAGSSNSLHLLRRFCVLLLPNFSFPKSILQFFLEFVDVLIRTNVSCFFSLWQDKICTKRAKVSSIHLSRIWSSMSRVEDHRFQSGGIEKNLDRIRLFSWIRSFADGEGSLWICRGHTVGNKYLGAT